MANSLGFNIKKSIESLPTKKKKKEEAETQTVKQSTKKTVKKVNAQDTRAQFDKNRSFNDVKDIRTVDTVNKKKSTTNDNVVDNVKFLGKSAKTGAVGAVTGIADVPLQETQNALEKGKNLKTPMDIVKNSTKGVIKGLSPSVGLLFDAYDKIKSNLKGERKNFAQSALDSYQSLYNATNPFEPVKDELTSLGAINPNLDKKVAKAREKLNAPAEKMSQELAEEAKQYSGLTKTLGTGMQQVGFMSPSILTAAITKDPQLALYGVMGASAKGSSTREAELAGADLDTAIKMGNVKAAGEVISENLTGGLNVFGKGALDDIATKFVDKTIGNKGLNFLAKQVLGVVGEQSEEVMTDLLGTLIDRGTIDPNKKYTPEDLIETLKSTAVSTLLLNGLTGGYSRNAYNQNALEMQQNRQIFNNTPNLEASANLVNDLVQKVQSGEISMEQANQQMEQINNGSYQENRNLEDIAKQQVQQIQQAVQNGAMTVEQGAREIQAVNLTLDAERERINTRYSQTNLNDKVQEQTQQQTQEQAQQQTKPTDTEDKIQNFRNSVENEHIEDADGFYKAAEKIIQDKDYNVIMDSSITNEDGKSVNALIETGENGEITIKINPKSERAGEILLMHEVTHGIETKQMRNLIMDFAKKNEGFNEALESLKKTYGTEDVTPEVIADISGQLFGNQEFIDSLSTENPSLFKRIHDLIVSLKNKLTGNSKYENFVKDLAVKYENAYRKANKQTAKANIQETAKYSQNSEEIDFENLTKKGNVKTNKNTDSEGKELSKGQKEFYKDSKVRDENGALIRVYHTTTNPVVQFNTFNPVGTPGYRFGDQVVIYASASKDMSGSYANQNYEMADTQKLNSAEEANDWLFEVGLPFYEVSENTVFDDEGTPILKYKNEDQLLRNIKSDIQKELGAETALQYEAYLNMKNPFIVESEGSNWDAVERRYDEARAKLYDDTLKNRKQELLDLVSESKQKQKTEYEDKRVRNQIETSAQILENFKDTKYSKFFQKVGVGEDVLELHEAFRDAKDYNDFLERVYTKDESGKSKYGVNIELPSANTKMSDLINEETIDHYKDSKIGDVISNLDNKTFGEFMDGLISLYETEGVYGTADRYFWFNMNKVFGDENVDEIIEPGEWIAAADLDFDQEAKEMLEKKALSTNDVVKLIIEENKQKSESEKYDGIIFKKIYDYAGESTFDTPEDVYVVFQPNQIKAVDNLNPTSDPDIRYSKKADKWQKWLEGNFKNEGTTTNLKEKIKKPTKKEVAKQQTKEVINNFNAAKKGKLKERSYPITATEATGDQELLSKADRKALEYQVQSNKDSYEKAKKSLEGKTYQQRVDRVLDKLNSDKKVTLNDVVEAQIVLLEASQSNQTQDYLNILQDLSIMQTELGQMVQAASMIQKMSPDGQIAMLDKIVSRQQALGNKVYEKVKLNPDKVQKVLDSYKDEKHTTFDQKKLDEAMYELEQDIADQMKVTIGEKVNAWRYLSMLGNFKTHIRNVVANGAMYAVNKNKNVLASIGEATAQKAGLIDQSQRTKTLKKASKDVKDFTNLAYEEVFSNSENTGNKYNDKKGLEAKRKIFKNKVLEYLRNLNDKALTAEDQLAKKITFKDSFSTYLTAQGIKTTSDINAHPEIVQAAKAFALNEANVATFNQENKLAQWLNEADRKLGTPGQVIRGAIIPFTRTPLNIAKTGIEYTPGVGWFVGISEMKNAPKNMRGNIFVNNLSKQITGSSLALVGFALSQAGVLTGDSGDDKEDKFEKDQGAKMDYSIKIGGTSYDLSWLSPSSMPLFVGARMNEILVKQEKINPDFVVESLASTLDPLSEMSCLSGFTKVLKSYKQDSAGMYLDIGESTARNYASQFLPTLLGQFSQAIDTKKRSTYPDKNSTFKFGQQTLRELQYKTPARVLLPEQTDYYGEAKKEEENPAIRAIKAFFSPVNTRKDNMSKESKELIRIYKETGNEDVLPTGLQSYLNYNGNKYDMSQKDYNNYKKDYGDAFKDTLNSLMNSTRYNNSSDDEKAEMIAGIMKYSKDKAKDNYLTEQGEDYVKTNEDGTTSYYESDKVDNLTNDDFSIADYYVYKVKAPNVVSGRFDNIKNKISMTQVFGIDPITYSNYLEGIGDIEADYTASGKLIRNSKKRKVAEYLDSFGLDSTQKAALFRQQYKSYKSADSQITNYIINSDLSEEEKVNLASFLKFK